MLGGRKMPIATPRRLVAALAVLMTLLPAMPVQAQVMTPNGWPVPSFFFSGTEQRAREACAEKRPECRASVRAQMEYEMAISLFIPWVLVGIAALGGLSYARVQEKKKQKARMLARAHHDPGKFRKLDADGNTPARKTDDDDEDNL
jgi:hypothetical protein